VASSYAVAPPGMSTSRSSNDVDQAFLLMNYSGEEHVLRRPGTYQRLPLIHCSALCASQIKFGRCFLQFVAFCCVEKVACMLRLVTSGEKAAKIAHLSAFV